MNNKMTDTKDMPESYTKEWYEKVIKKDPELLKWFHETVMIPEYYDLDKQE